MEQQTIHLYTGLRQMAHADLAHSAAACAAAQTKLRELLQRELPTIHARLIDRLKTLVLTEHDLTAEQRSVTESRIIRALADELFSAGLQLAARLQVQLRADLTAHIDQLYSFAVTADRFLEYILAENAGTSSSLTDGLRQWRARQLPEAQPGGEQSTFTGLLAGMLGFAALSRALATLPLAPPGTDDLQQLQAYYQQAAQAVLENRFPALERGIADYVALVFARLNVHIDSYLDDWWLESTRPRVLTAVVEESAGNCPTCGAETRAGFTFCMQCGATLAAKPAAALCRNCSAPLKAGVRFCGECGTRADA